MPLALEPLGLKHSAGYRRFSSDPENTRLMLFLPHEDDAEMTRFLQAAEAEYAKEYPEFYEMAVLLDGECIGSVSAYSEENGTAWELGWIIGKEHWGHGYAAEAALQLIEFCRLRRGAARFIAHCDSENAASRRVMEKLGMKLVSEYPGRKNRSSDEERRECLYELTL